MVSKRHVFIVETEPLESGGLTPALKAAGYTVAAYADESAAFPDVVRERPEFLLVDEQLRKENVFEFLSRVVTAIPFEDWPRIIVLWRPVPHNDNQYGSLSFLPDLRLPKADKGRGQSTSPEQVLHFFGLLPDYPRRPRSFWEGTGLLKKEYA